MTELSKELRTRLSQYAAGQLNAEDFEQWFSAMFRNLHTANDSEAEFLAHSVEWAARDLEAGRSTVEIFQSRLKELAEQPAPTVRGEIKRGGCAWVTGCTPVEP